MRRGREHDVAQEARRLLGRLDRRGNLERARAVTVWQEVAGPDVACHAAGFAMRDEELVVYVDTAVWASELSALSEHYRVAVNAVLGREMVGSIRFTVSRHARRRAAANDEGSGDTAESARVDPVPLDAGERKRLSALAAAIHDDRLREAALGAAERHLEWRKGLEGRETPQTATGGSPDPKSRSEH